MRVPLLIIVSILTFIVELRSQDLSDVPVYMHYMPWFETPNEDNGSAWGYHWKMASADPNQFNSQGNRQIASHYYPLIGPYCSSDVALLEYHILLMKHAGIDGIILDWYGVKGGNHDIDILTRNTEAFVRVANRLEMPYCLMVEDKFWRDTRDAEASLAYAKKNFFPQKNYLKGPENRPYLPVFGPSNLSAKMVWEELNKGKYPPVLITLLGTEQKNPIQTDGSFSWVYEENIEPLRHFYEHRVDPEQIKWGSAYARFHDYYKEGKIKNSLFQIRDSNGYWLERTLELASMNKVEIDAVQLVTFNDFGEGTALEPTKEFGFRDLAVIRKFTMGGSSTYAFKVIYRNYLTQVQNKLDLRQQRRYKRIVKLLSEFNIEKAHILLIRTLAELNLKTYTKNGRL